MYASSLKDTRLLKLLLALTATIAAVALVACGGSDSDSSSTPSNEPAAGASSEAAADIDLSGVKLRVGVQKDGIRSFLEQSGAIDDTPYEIEWSSFTAGPPLVEAASADKIDVAWVGSAPPIFGAAADAGFKVVAAFQERDFKENSILVPAGSDIKTVKDLKGKKIAVGKGTSAHGLLVNALNRAGLTADDVEIAFLLPPDGLAAFSTGSVDAWTVWDPFVTQAVLEQGAVEVTGGKPDEQALQFEIASAAALEDETRRAAVADFVYRLGQGFDWAVNNPDKWGKAWADESGLPVKVTTQVAKNKALDMSEVTDDIIAKQQDLADVFYSAGELPVEVDFSSVVDQELFAEGEAVNAATSGG